MNVKRRGHANKVTLRVTLLAAALCTPAVVFGQPCPLADPNQSFYVPQAGSVAIPTEGTSATRFFRACPDNDGGSSLPNNVRIKIVLRDGTGVPLVGVPAEQIYTLFNGGTPAQGFSGIGADSIISNSTWNPAPTCPDVRDMIADAPTDINGATYITFGGNLPGSPGTYQRNSGYKWGHFDSEIPVFVGRPPCIPIQVKGKLTSASPLGSYVLRIKNVDVVAGLGPVLNQGERETINDFNTCVACAAAPGGIWCYWCDLDYSGAVAATDINVLLNHMSHSCQFPLSP